MAGGRSDSELEGENGRQHFKDHGSPAADSAKKAEDTTMSRSPSVSSSTSGLSSDDERLLDQAIAPRERVSIYVQVFEEMLNTVLEHESHLFNEGELDTLARFKQMSYPARYLFVRLFARKNGWFRTARLKYHDELADVQAAVDELCGAEKAVESVSMTPQPRTVVDEPEEPVAGPSRPRSPKAVQDESAIHILSDADEQEIAPVQMKSIARIKSTLLSDPLTDRSVKEVKQDQADFGLSRFAINEQILAERNNVDELLALLSLDELKALGKDLRIPSNYTTRPTLMEAIRRTSSNQSTITSMFAASAAKAKAKAETLLSITNRKIAKVIDKGKQRAAAPMPAPQRQTEVLIHKILQYLGQCVKLESGPIRLFARLHLLYYRSVSYSEKTLTQAVLGRFKIRNYPSYTVKRSFSIFADRQALIEYEEALILERRIEDLTGEATDPTILRRMRKYTKEDREKDMREALTIFEAAYPRWKAIVASEKQKDEEAARLRKEQGTPDDRLTYYRKRFLAGWPLTRVVYKGATILARLHEYDRETEVLESLLGQSCFRRGKRGEWYDRLALVYMHHHAKLKQDDTMNKAQYQEKALALCYEGLNHPWTHLIYHNSLARRIVRLQSALNTPTEDRHPPVSGLRAAHKRVIRGEKLSEGETGKKSIWRAADGDETSVEELCLDVYKSEGWKGFHSENGILTTIFSLLFWDVIFAPIDGVFETAYQSGPLDLSTDAFAIVRADLVKERLASIEAGEGPKLLEATDLRERENKTYCVGLKWAYERNDLLEIIQCFTPHALSMICRVYAEEWSHRVGGVPDLFLWNIDKKTCRLVEVKGPGDFLSETQKVWIDVLLSAGVSVELCSVHQILEEDDLELSETESPKKKQISPAAKRKLSESDDEQLDSAPAVCADKQNGERSLSKKARARSTSTAKPENAARQSTGKNVPAKPVKSASKSKVSKIKKKSKSIQKPKPVPTGVDAIIVLSD